MLIVFCLCFHFESEFLVGSPSPSMLGPVSRTPGWAGLGGSGLWTSSSCVDAVGWPGSDVEVHSFSCEM